MTLQSITAGAIKYLQTRFFEEANWVGLGGSTVNSSWRYLMAWGEGFCLQSCHLAAGTCSAKNAEGTWRLEVDRKTGSHAFWWPSEILGAKSRPFEGISIYPSTETQQAPCAERRDRSLGRYPRCLVHGEGAWPAEVSDGQLSQQCHPRPWEKIWGDGAVDGGNMLIQTEVTWGYNGQVARLFLDPQASRAGLSL